MFPASLQAQEVSHAWLQWWDGPAVIHAPLAHMGHHSPLREVTRDWPNGRRETLKMPSTPYQSHLSVCEGKVFLVQVADPQKPESALKIRLSEDFKTWVDHGVLESEPAPGHGNLPTLLSFLDADLALGTGGATGFWKDGHGAPMALFRRDAQGRFRLHRLLSLGLDRPYSKLTQQPGQTRLEPRPFTQDPAIARVYRSSAALDVELADYVVKVGTTLGTFLVFDRKGRHLRTSVLYPKALDQVVEKKAYSSTPQMILGMAPTKDGEILLAVRREVCMYSQDFHPVDMSLKNWSNPDTQRMNALAMKERLRLDPAVDWKLFDPATGRFRDTPSPRHVPTELKDLATFKAFTFRFKPDGNLYLGMKDEDWKP